MSEIDPFNLARFVEAQERDYDRALSELKAGRKRSHWMWYVFPQLEGLGSSPTSRYFAVRNADEAAAYLAHPILGPRLVQVSEAVLHLEGRSANDVFGFPDDMKLRSSATLFASVSPEGSVFHRILEKYFDARADDRTLDLLRQ